MYKLIKIWIFIKSVVTNAIIIADEPKANLTR